MKLLPSILLAVGLTIVPSSVGMPAVSPNSSVILPNLMVDNLPPSDMFIDCSSYAGYLYAAPQIMDAIQKGIDLTSIVAPPGGHPHRFGNNRLLPFSNFCTGKALWEFPLLPRGVLYNGGDPGTDRVVFFIYTNNPVTDPTMHGAYCGVMTHVGAPQGEFNLCTLED